MTETNKIKTNYDEKFRADNVAHIIAHAITSYLHAQTIKDKTINLVEATLLIVSMVKTKWFASKLIIPMYEYEVIKSDNLNNYWELDIDKNLDGRL